MKETNNKFEGFAKELGKLVFPQYMKDPISYEMRLRQLRNLADIFGEEEYKYITPEQANIITKEDWGGYRGDAFSLLPLSLMQAYPGLDYETASRLGGIHILPERASIPRPDISLDEYQTYLKGHETHHQISSGFFRQLNDMLRKTFLTQGSRGYLPLRRSEFQSYSGIENWLKNYPLEERGEERAAHKRGLEWLGIFPYRKRIDERRNPPKTK